MNIRAACAVFSMAAGCFYAQAFAGAAGEDVAMQGLTPKTVQAANRYALGVCRTASPSAGAEIAPTIDGDTYMSEYRSNDPRYRAFNFSSGAKVTVIKAPQHGDVTMLDDPLNRANHWYHYMPTDKGYSGRDRFEVLVEKDDVQIRILYLIEVLDEYDTPTGRCQYGHRKISSTTFAPSTQDSAAWLRSSELSSRSAPIPLPPLPRAIAGILPPPRRTTLTPT